MSIKSFFTKKKIIIAIIVLFFLSIAFQKIFANPKANGKKIETARVERGNLKEIMTISGEIAAEDNAILQFQTGGRVSWVGVKEGDYVKKYQAIAALDQRDVKMRIDRYLNTYLKARWDLDQVREDNKDKALTNAIDRTIDKYQFDLNNSVLDVELYDLARNFANLWTPIEGLVVRADIKEPGINISLASQGIFQVINPKTVYLEAIADQTEVTKLKEGMEGTILLDSYPDKEIKGKIETISFTPKVGETGTVYTVKFIFDNDNSDYKYRVGMTGDLDFTINEKGGVLIVPSKFIKSQNGDRYVNVSKNGQSEKVKVETGLETDSGTEIVSGLVEGDTIHD